MKTSITLLMCCLTSFCLITAAQRAEAQQTSSPPTVTFYEDDNGWEGQGKTMQLSVGSYSNRGRGENKTLRPNQQAPRSLGRGDEWNDEVRAVIVPAGLTVYMTDDDSFKPGRHGVVTLTGPWRGNIKEKNSSLAGKVSSIRITAAAPAATTTHDYSVKIFTGPQVDAGTTANVYITLHGTAGVSPEVRVNPLVEGVPFQVRQGDDVVLKLQRSIGKVTGVTIRSDYKNQDRWWLHYISAGGHTFDFNHWFDNTQPQTRRAAIK